jgi:hypothetical protein
MSLLGVQAEMPLDVGLAATMRWMRTQDLRAAS